LRRFDLLRTHKRDQPAPLPARPVPEAAKRVGSRWGRVMGRLAVVAVVVIGGAGLTAVPAHAQGSADWPAYLFDTGHSSYNADATAISTSNLANLNPVWQWFEDPSKSNKNFFASPTVVDGVVYIGSQSGWFYAISESNQSVLWSRYLGVTPRGVCGPPMGIAGTAVVADDPATGQTVYVNSADGQLYALNAATGAILWQATVDTPSTTLDDYYAWGSPLVANGSVYVGISSNCDAPLVPAGVVSFNQDTGAPQATWHSLSGGASGASVWSTPAASTLGDGSIFVTTGNVSGTAQPASAESLVRLSGDNLSLLDSWQVPVSQQLPDADFGGSPTVFTADINGTPTPMVGACNKNGIYYAFKQNDLHDGPVWQWRMAAGYNTKPFTGQCDAAAVWDGTNLIEGGGNSTTINSVTYDGSVQSLDPATGKPIWQTGIPGNVVGSPTEDGAGVVAATTYHSATGQLGVYLLNAATGAILDYINTNPSPVFGQPVFANNDLLIAGTSTIGLTDYEITTPGPAITNVAPNAIGTGGTKTLTLTGSGFSGTPSVFVSGTLVTPSSVTVLSPTSLQVTLHAATTAATGPRDITVIEPGPIADSCSGCLTIDPPPTVSSGNPNSFIQGQKTTVTVTGSNFVSGARLSSASGISFSSTKFVNSGQMTGLISVQPSVAPGTYKLYVTNPDGGVGSCACVTVAADPQPTLTSVSPGAVGQQNNQTLTLTGTGFTTNSTVAFSAANVTIKSVTYVSPTSLSAYIYVPSTAPTGASDVTVTTPGGSATCSGCLTIDPHPVLTKLSPNTIPNGTTAQITVTGSNFVTGLNVTVTIPGATVGTPTQVTATSFTVPVTVASGTTPGTYTFKVINPDRGAATTSIKTT
jgi:outer membrane protein assembly factor BamB